MEVIDHAARYLNAGLSVIPVKMDGSKSPALTGWRKYSNERADDETAAGWFSSGEHGIGVVPGPASGNLVVLDFENKYGIDAYAEWAVRLPSDAAAVLATCPIVRTPSGGCHVWVRLDNSQEGGRLARYSKGATKVEIRGEGHQVLAPGCPKECHKSGEEYQFLSDGWLAEGAEPKVVPAETWRVFLQEAVGVNEWSAPDLPAVAPERAVGPLREDAPGTDFNRRGSWDETGLFDHGWTWARNLGERGLICRPGKNEGVSASVGMVTSKENGWPLFYCWSTNVPEFVSEQPYSRFAVFTALKHNGNFHEAAKALAQSGYGNAMPEVKVRLSSVMGEETIPSVDGEEKPFRWMSELRFRPENDKWIWHGYLSRGGITMLSALWKSGKSTLLSYALRAFDGRTTEFCGRAIMPSRVLYVSEEHEELWAERRDSLGIGDHVGMVSRPFKGRPSPAEWVAFIHSLIGSVEKYRFDVVIIDTLSKLWPVREENDAGQVEEALMPLWQLTKTGVGLLLVHHSRKSDGNQFTGSRGSGGLPAFCETLVEFRRDDESDSKNYCRILSAAGRYKETPAKWKIELTSDGYVSHGDPDDGPQVVMKDTSWRGCLDSVLPWLPPGMTFEEINAGLKEYLGKAGRRQDVLAELNSRFEQGKYGRTGNGTRTGPYRYHLSASAVPSPDKGGEQINGNGTELGSEIIGS